MEEPLTPDHISSKLAKYFSTGITIKVGKVLCSGATMRAEDKVDECVVLYSVYMSKYNLAEPSILQKSRMVAWAPIQLK